METQALDGMFQESHDAIFASGAFANYPWWYDKSAMHFISDDGTVPSYWGYRLISENREDEDATPVETEIWHSTLVAAMKKIADGEFSDLEGTRSVDHNTVTECQNFTEGREADFDSDTADQVLQVVVYGAVVFG